MDDAKQLEKDRETLVKNFRKYPKCADSEKAARALVMDSIPELRAEKSILILLYQEGFVGRMMDSGQPGVLISKYRTQLTKEYGYSDRIVDWCISTWICILIDGLGIEIDGIIDKSSDTPGRDELVRVKSERDRLLEEICNLKALISALTAERDNLLFKECRDLAAEYNARIGEIELQVLNAKLRVMELKRTIEILQAWINRQERISEKRAKEQAKREFEEFEEELNRKAEEARRTNRYQKDEEEKEREWQQEQENDDSDEKREKYKSRTDEMKALYRKIVKALHPDMNPDQTPEEKELFTSATDAYKCSDLDKLREIAALVDEGNLDKDGMDLSGDDFERLENIIDGLRSHLESLQFEIDDIKSSFPYTMKDFLKDEEAVATRQKELTGLLYEYNEQIAELEERLMNMLKKKEA